MILRKAAVLFRVPVLGNMRVDEVIVDANIAAGRR